MTIRRGTTLHVCFDPGCPAEGGEYVAPDPDEPDRDCLACGRPEDEHDGGEPEAEAT